jgi:hypothetical protein
MFLRSYDVSKALKAAGALGTFFFSKLMSSSTDLSDPNYQMATIASASTFGTSV